MNKMNTQEELKGKLEEINTSIAKRIQNIDEYEFEATKLEVESDDVNRYLFLLRNPDVTKYINAHNQIGKNKKELASLEEQAKQTKFQIKQFDCNHPVLLETRVDGADDSIKETVYSYVCLECRKHIISGTRSNRIIVSKYFNQDYELSEEEISDIEESYTNLREKYQHEDIKKLIKKITL